MAFRVLALIVLMSTSLSASGYYIWGTGEDSCSAYIGAIAEYRHRGNPADHQAHINWIKGFITGINWAKDSDVAKDLDEAAVANWVDRYCRDNFSSNVAAAAAKSITRSGSYSPVNQPVPLAPNPRVNPTRFHCVSAPDSHEACLI